MCRTSSSPSSPLAWSAWCWSRRWSCWLAHSPMKTSRTEGRIMDNRKFIEIQDAHMSFNTRNGVFQALRDINLTVAKGEFITLIGHSGCGKSTLLNLIAGLLKASGGALLCANREIAGPAPERAVVFQNHSLLPWLTCFE